MLKLVRIETIQVIPAQITLQNVQCPKLSY